MSEASDFVSECFVRSLCFDDPQSLETDKAILRLRHRREWRELKAKQKKQSNKGKQWKQ